MEGLFVIYIMLAVAGLAFGLICSFSLTCEYADNRRFYTRKDSPQRVEEEAKKLLKIYLLSVILPPVWPLVAIYYAGKGLNTLMSDANLRRN